MKWFKHLSGSLNDSFIFELIEQFGSDGYLVFFGTIELMADEFDIDNPGKSEFSVRKLTKNLQISRRKLTEVLSFTTEKERLIAIINYDKIQLNCPRLKDLCDNWTQKLLRSNLEADKKLLKPKEEEVRSKKKEEDNKSKEPSCPGSEKPKPVPRKISFTDMDMKLARLLNNLMERNNPSMKPKTETMIESWANECRLARTGKEKRTYEGLEKVLRWSQDDSFWKGNILSMSTLRDKYDALVLRMNENPKNVGHEYPIAFRRDGK